MRVAFQWNITLVYL